MTIFAEKARDTCPLLWGLRVALRSSHRFGLMDQHSDVAAGENRRQALPREVQGPYGALLGYPTGI